jgi:hypothetical protein
MTFKSEYDQHDEFYARVELLRPLYGNWDAFDPVAHAILDVVEAQSELADAFEADAHDDDEEAAFKAAMEKRYDAGKRLMNALENRDGWPDPLLGLRHDKAP